MKEQKKWLEIRAISIPRGESMNSRARVFLLWLIRHARRPTPRGPWVVRFQPKTIAKAMDCHTRTVARHLNFLHHWQWIELETPGKGRQLKSGGPLWTATINHRKLKSATLYRKACS